MPERDKSVMRIAGKIVRAKVFDGLTGNVRRPPISAGHWRALQAMVDEVWVEEVKKIDWNRVILHAHNQHVALVEKDSSHGAQSEHQGGLPLLGFDPGSDADALCSDCLVNSLLSLSTMGPTVEEPEHDDEEDVLWRAEWIQEGGGRLMAFQAVLPHIFEALHAADGGLPSDDDG